MRENVLQVAMPTLNFAMWRVNALRDPCRKLTTWTLGTLPMTQCPRNSWMSAPKAKVPMLAINPGHREDAYATCKERHLIKALVAIQSDDAGESR